jgi:predicted aminopeptidase
VPAYSTLGWMNWAGGDPLLNTFIRYPEGELARLMFHELAHQVLYVPDDTSSTSPSPRRSSSWAATLAGAARWRPVRRDAGGRRHPSPAVPAAGPGHPRAPAADLPGRAGRPPTRAARAWRGQGQTAMADFRADYAALKESWGGFAGYDSVGGAGQQRQLRGAQAAYDELVPGFEALFLREGQDWRAFYDAVRLLAECRADARRRALSTTGNSTGRGHGG